MRPISPRIIGLDERQYDGDEYKSIIYALQPTHDDAGQVDGVHAVTRWTLTDEDRAAIAAGADVFVMTHNMLPGMQVHVGYPYGVLER